MLSRNAFLLFLIAWVLFSFAWIITDENRNSGFVTGAVIGSDPFANAPSAGVEAPVKEFSIESGHVLEEGKARPVPRFMTTEITVNKGDRVKINIHNFKGRHDFKIDEFNAYVETPEGEPATVEFVADKAGEFIYYCARPGHRANGHWGTLIVKE